MISVARFTAFWLASAWGVALAAGSSIPRVAGVDGRLHNLVQEARGRPIVLIFISHDCPICNSYAPEIARIAGGYGRRVEFALVYAEANLSVAQANRHAGQYGLTNVLRLLDPKGRLAEACGAKITPESVILLPAKGQTSANRAYLGRIDDLYYGWGRARPAATRHDLRRALDAVLNHLPATPPAGPPFGCVIEVTSAK